MKNNFKASVQVDTSHYQLKQGSFNNLYNQIHDVEYIINMYNLVKPSVLIIGVGDSMLGILLNKKFNCIVKTMDIDPKLKPDYVGSVDNVSDIVEENFDIIVCTHVLEHLPFKYFHKILAQIKVKADYALIYLPIARFGIVFGIGVYPLFFKKIYFISTWFFKKHRFDGQHYWEIGVLGYSKKKIRRGIGKYFEIKKEYNPENRLYSYSFVLKSKK